MRNEALVQYKMRPREGMKFRDRVRVRDASSTQQYWSIKHTVLYRGLPSILPTIAITLHIQRHSPRPQGHQCDKMHRGQGSDTNTVCTPSPDQVPHGSSHSLLKMALQVGVCSFACQSEVHGLAQMTL